MNCRFLCTFAFAIRKERKDILLNRLSIHRHEKRANTYYWDCPNKDLSELLEAEVIIIPAQNGDMTGHADGMVRFIDHDTILGNNRSDEYKYWKNGIEKVLKDYSIKYIDVPFFYGYKDSKHPDNAIGVYVNYLEVGNLIILPVFEVEGNKDAEAIAAFKQIFPDKMIEAIKYNEVALEGGTLNCSTWTYKSV